MLPVIDFGAVTAKGHAVFDFAGDGAGMATNAALDV